MRRPPFLIAGMVLVACLDPATSFDPAQDDTAVSAVTRNWSGSGATLSLCEDVAVAASTPASGCQIANVARGGGLGVTHSQARGGCGGCPLDNVAYVTGTVSSSTLPPGTAVSGQVDLGNGYDDDPYAFPYTLELTCTDPSLECRITGTLEADGSLNLSIDDGGIASTTLTVDFAPGSAATCGS